MIRQIVSVLKPNVTGNVKRNGVATAQRVSRQNVLVKVAQRQNIAVQNVAVP